MMEDIELAILGLFCLMDAVNLKLNYIFLMQFKGI